VTDDGDVAGRFAKPLLRGSDSKSDDFFADFLLPTVGGRFDWSRIRGLEASSSGLNRPLTTRTRTFCELSESVTSVDVSSNFYASVFDLFGSALKVSDKCPFAKLSSLSLRDNRIAAIGLNDFLFSPNLETLDVSSNKIDRVDAGALRHLTSLKTLDLSDNQLSSASPPPWLNLTQLRELYLQGNRLDRLPDFSGLRHLVALNLSRNAIASLPENSFGNLGDLVALDLSHNRIVDLPDESFSGLKSLQVSIL
jgi:Leucine-rich repeat (LRR) protein